MRASTCRLMDLFRLRPRLRPVFSIHRSTVVLDSPEQAVKFFRRIWNKQLLTEQEQVYVIYVDDELQPIEWPCIHTGGVCKTVIDVKVIIQYAIGLKASGLFLAHNHPRGSIRPSVVDIKMTNNVIDACRLFDVKFYDHVILGLKDYSSFQESGLLD